MILSSNVVLLSIGYTLTIELGWKSSYLKLVNQKVDTNSDFTDVFFQVESG